MAITGAGGTGCHDRLQPPKFRSPPASSPRSLPAARRTVVRERGRWTSVRTHGLAGKRLAPSRERVTPAASRSHRRCSPALRDRRRPAARPPPVRRGSHGAAARRCHCGGCGRCTHTPPSQLEQVGDGGTCGEDVVDRDSVDLDIERCSPSITIGTPRLCADRSSSCKASELMIAPSTRCGPSESSVARSKSRFPRVRRISTFHSRRWMAVMMRAASSPK